MKGHPVEIVTNRKQLKCPDRRPKRWSYRQSISKSDSNPEVSLFTPSVPLWELIDILVFDDDALHSLGVVHIQSFALINNITS